GLAPPAPCRSPGAPVSKRAQAKNSQNCFLYWLLPTVVASAIGFQIDEIEMEFLQENSAWEFSHSLGQKAKYSLRADVFRVAPDSGHCATQSACRFVPRFPSRNRSTF